MGASTDASVWAAIRRPGCSTVALEATRNTQLEALAIERDKLAAENEELRGQLLHRQADFENFRRRVENERADFARYAGMEAVRELLPVLFKRELDQQQVGLALGECIAHLNYLHQRGQVERLEDEEGRYRYRSVDDTLPLRLRKHRHEAELMPPVQV